MGHAMHSYTSTKYQAPLDCHYKIFVAEVASNSNEALIDGLFCANKKLRS